MSSSCFHRFALGHFALPGRSQIAGGECATPLPSLEKAKRRPSQSERHGHRFPGLGGPPLPPLRAGPNDPKSTCTHTSRWTCGERRRGTVQIASVPQGCPPISYSGVPRAPPSPQHTTREQPLARVADPGRNAPPAPEGHKQVRGPRPGSSTPASGDLRAPGPRAPAPPPPGASQRPFVPPSPRDSSS